MVLGEMDRGEEDGEEVHGLLRELARFSLIEWNSNDAALFSMHRLVQQVQLDVILLDDAELETTEATTSERMAGACVRVVNRGLAKGNREREAEGWAVGMNTTNRWLLHALYMHESYAWLCESTMKEVGHMLAWVGNVFGDLGRHKDALRMKEETLAFVDVFCPKTIHILP